jgi:hypothetical protein
MAVDREKLTKFVRMMESEHDGECMNALRMIKKMAAAEKMNLAELLLTPAAASSGSSHGGQQQRRPHDRYEPFKWGFNFEEAMRKAAEEEQRERDRAASARQAAREAEARRREAEQAARAKQREEDRKAQFRGGFDDAEMTDEEREARRNKKAKARRERSILLDELKTAFVDGRAMGILTGWEREFAEDILDKHSEDWELSAKQVDRAERLIRKVQMNQSEPPI